MPGLVGGVGAFDYFPPCQNPRSSAAGLAILRPRGGCGPGFLSSLVRTRWGSRSFIYLFIYLFFPRSSAVGLAILRARGDCGLDGFLASLVRTRWVASEHFFLFFLLFFSLPELSVLRGGPRRLEAERRLRSRLLCSLFTGPRFPVPSGIFFFLPCSIPSGWSQGPRPGGGWAPGFVACPPRSLGPFMVMRSTSCSFEGRFSCLWGHFWDMSPSLTFRSPLWSVNCSLYLVSFF